MLLCFLKDISHFSKNIFIFKNENQISFTQSNFPETNHNLDSSLAWELKISNFIHKLLLSAGGKTFCLTATTQFSISDLYICHHFIPCQDCGMQKTLSLKFKTSKLRWAIVGLGLGFVTNSIINHLFPALGVTTEPNGSFSITASYNVHIFLLFLTGLKVQKF